jgi:hypothetical protein
VAILRVASGSAQTAQIVSAATSAATHGCLTGDIALTLLETWCDGRTI